MEALGANREGAEAEVEAGLASGRTKLADWGPDVAAEEAKLNVAEDAGWEGKDREGVDDGAGRDKREGADVEVAGAAEELGNANGVEDAGV